MISEGDTDLTTYLNQLLGTNKPEQQNNTFWFQPSESPGKTEDHTSTKTRIVREILELKEKTSIQETTQNLEVIALNDLIRLLQC